MRIIIDAGHGFDTLGKRSPDGAFLEWQWNREVASLIYDNFAEVGVEATILIPESHDVPLQERVKRVNSICEKIGARNALLISVHSNAAGSNGWNTAKGWECYTTRGITKSDAVAECLYDAFEEEFTDRRIRKDLADGDRDKEADFYIIKHALCPAVLLENFFYDNKEECEWLLTTKAKERIAKATTNGIIKYLSR